MTKFERRKIFGKWREGFALDLHTVSSIYIGDDEYGHPRFDTRRSEIGELLYKLKNKADKNIVPEIVDAVELLLKEWNPPVDILVPVPPSTWRVAQPVGSLGIAGGICPAEQSDAGVGAHFRSGMSEACFSVPHD